LKALEEMLESSKPLGLDPTPPPTRPSRWYTGLDRLRSASRRRLWPITVLFAALASAATITSAATELVRDNRFEQFWNPARRIAKSLTVWDGSRGLGRVREDFWPGTTAPLAVLRGLGLSPVLSQKLWHALVLVLLGVGTVAVLRLFRLRIGVEHLFAGLAVMFGAYSAAFLVPSNLAFQVALAPWFIVALWRGVTETRPWRWAALFALLVFLAGNTDLPGLIYSMVPLIPVSIYLLVVDRSIRVRDLAAWLARAGLLCLLISTAAIAKTLAASASFEQRLAETEAPQVSSVTSSWAESFRGLGNWLSYFHQSGSAQKPQGEPYFVAPVVILATFVPPVVAALVLWRSRWRPRVLFAWMIICSLVIMVEAFPLDSPSPIGRFLLDLLTNVPSLEAFRNTYKAGAGLAVGIAVLFGVGVAAAARWAGREGVIPRRAALIGALLVVLAAAIPFWTGGLYDGDRAMTSVPSYWTQAFSFLDGQSADTRVLVLPASSRTHYRWGWIGDDIFDAMLIRDHAVATGIPLSTPLAANLIEAISVTSTDPAYQPGTLAPVLRRLGISEVVLRNDLDWQEMGRPRPAAYAGLRSDPDFQLAASFGDPGQNTTSDRDHTSDAVVEQTLPPVEVYQLNDARPELRASAAQPSLVVSGDGYAWPGLAGSGLLAGDAPLEYSGSLDGTALETALSAGSPLVVTDTNRRRLRVVVAHEPDYSYVLSDGQALDRPTQSLFPDPATQSTAWYPDASSISLSGKPRSIDGSEPWNRPANAFDGDPETEWVMGPADEPEGRTFRIQLRQPTTVSQIRVALASGITSASGVSQLKLRFSEGPEVLVNLTDPVTELVFGPRQTSYIDVQILGVAPTNRSVGFSDITFPGVDLREFVQTPTDVVDQAARDGALAAELLRAPTSFLFSRDTTAPSPGTSLRRTLADQATTAELAMRRRFITVGTRPYTLNGVLHVGTRTSDAALNALLGIDNRSESSARAAGDLAGWGGFAADGDLSTAWVGPAQAGASVTVTVPPHELTSVTVHTIADAKTAAVTTVQVTVDGQTTSADLDTSSCTSPTAECQPTATVPLRDRPTSGEVKVSVAAVDEGGSQARDTVKISEVEVNRVANSRLDTPAALPDVCQSLGLTLDGTDVPVRLSGTRSALLAGMPISWQSCPGVELAAGPHELVTTDSPLFDRAQVATADVPMPGPVTGPSTAVEVVSSSPTFLHLRVSGPGPTTLWLGQSFDDRWTATSDGSAAQGAVALDTQSGWRIDGAGTRDVVLRFRPGYRFQFGLAVTGLTVALCLWLVLRRGRPAPPAPDPEQDA